MAAMLEMLNPNSEVDPKGVLETATNFISTTLRTLIFSPSSPPGYASENDNKLNLISLSEVALHDQIDDCWIVIYDRVYDITSFFDQHPGGIDILMEYAGRDGTVSFTGHSMAAMSSLKSYEIGILPPKERIYRWPGMLKLSTALPE